MSQMKYDCLHMCVLISKQSDGLANVQEGVGAQTLF